MQFFVAELAAPRPTSETPLVSAPEQHEHRRLRPLHALLGGQGLRRDEGRPVIVKVVMADPASSSGMVSVGRSAPTIVGWLVPLPVRQRGTL